MKWSTKKKYFISILTVFIIVYIATMLWHTYKPLPDGVSYKGDLHKTNQIEMMTDLTYAQDQKGTDIQHELTIFNEVFQMIDEAEEFIVLDLFLFDHHIDQNIEFPKIVETLTEKIIKKKKSQPDVSITFITDPINNGYGSYTNKWLQSMEEVGVEVVYTDLDALRDSTPIYSGLYRMFFQWFDTEGKGWIPNAIAEDAPDMRMASYLQLMNVKANHRKTIVNEKEAIVTSANPHNASGFNGNVALKVSGPVINDILEAEESIVKFTNGGTLPRSNIKGNEKGQYSVQYLTESKILDALLADIKATEKGDTIWLGMFFIAKRDILTETIDAANRGVEVKMILDPNKNSFGKEKSGLPNRPVVHEIMEDTNDGVDIRWYNTVIGQYHTKLIFIKTDEHSIISNGSANLTERTLDDYNLEANLRVIAPNDSELTKNMDAYFNRLWNNEDAMYTVDVEAYQDELTFWQRGIYSLQKIFKLTTY